jgi:hypothetical protein
MNDKIEKKWETLYKKYPDLFQKVGCDPRESCMSWGIECGIGWYDLISALLHRITQYEKNIKQKNDWHIKEHGKPSEKFENYYPVTLDQIKEKFGSLRFYFSGGDEFVEGLVSMAEEMSYKICERCGNPGTPNKTGWIRVLCDKCRNEEF